MRTKYIKKSFYRDTGKEIQSYLIKYESQNVEKTIDYLDREFKKQYNTVHNTPINLVQLAFFHMKKENIDRITGGTLLSSCTKLFKYSADKSLKNRYPDSNYVHHQSSLLFNFLTIAKTIQQQVNISSFFDKETQELIISLLNSSLENLKLPTPSDKQHKSITVIFNALGKLTELEHIDFKVPEENIIKLLKITVDHVTFMEPKELSSIILSLGRLVEHDKNFLEHALRYEWINKYIPNILSNLVTSKQLLIEKEKLNSEQWSITLYGITKLVQYLPFSPDFQHSLSLLLGYLLDELKIEEQNISILPKNSTHHHHFCCRLEFVIDDLKNIFNENNMAKTLSLLCFTALNITRFLLTQNELHLKKNLKENNASISTLILNFENRTGALLPNTSFKNTHLSIFQKTTPIEPTIDAKIIDKPLTHYQALPPSAPFQKKRLSIFETIASSSTIEAEDSKTVLYFD